MPIRALPPSAVRAIGSSQALSDSTSVVKELLDNAIDGRANRISIELSANTLDDIRVKDNGHGIGPDDRAMICTKYCTSKIRSFHDLENVGGRSLGFRGEALASAAELCGCLTITTRIEGEGTAVELKFDRKGQISGEKRTSHPVGTTVRIERYLQNLPVRRQAAEKTAVKMLAKVKRMLQAYALARPHLRLSLKILKAKDRKGDWTYPTNGALIASQFDATLHAATDIFGKKLTSQCIVVSSSWLSTGEQIDEATSKKLEPSASRDEAYNLEATLARRDGDASVLNNVGHYLSVDSRPVSCTRGTLKQIISLYKSHLRSSTFNEDTSKILDPFLCLNITCPPGSYDANVEPAKDDVLFTNSELLLRIFGRLFDNIYGEIQLAPPKPSIKKVSALKPHSFEVLLARKEPPVGSVPSDIAPVGGSTLPLPRSAAELSTHIQPRSSPLKISTNDSSLLSFSHRESGEKSKTIDNTTSNQPAIHETQAEPSHCLLPSHDTSIEVSNEEPGLEASKSAVSVGAKPGWKGTMYAVDEDDEADLEIHLQERPRSVDHDLDGDENLRDVEVSNPWAFAKLNAAMRSSSHKKQLHTPGRQIGDAGHSTDPSSDDLLQQVDPPSLKKPSPYFDQARSSAEAAYPTPSPFPFPLKARGKRKGDDTGINALSTASTSNKNHQNGGALDTWVQKSLGGYDELEHSSATLQQDQGPPDLPYYRDFISARSIPLGGTPLSEIPDASQRPRRKPELWKQHHSNIDRPHIPSVSDPNHVWFDNPEIPLQRRPRKPRPNNDHQDTTRAPTLILRDDEIEDDESVVPNTVERPPPSPIHPDLAIALDYETRKQKASEAHRKILREQAAAARKGQTHAPNPLHPQHTISSSSPHKNRQAAAIAALHQSNAPAPTLPSEESSILAPSDPRAHLLRIHHHQQQDQTPTPLRGKSKRQKSSLLPFETITEENFIGDLIFLIQDVNIDDVETDMKESGAWDQYIKSGEQGDGFGKVDMASIKRWEGKIRELYAEEEVERGRERVNMDVDLSTILRAHATEHA